MNHGTSSRLLTRPSAVLRALAEKIIPGVPENLRILLVGQTDTEAGNVNIADLTVVQYVLRLDARRERLLEEWKSMPSCLCVCYRTENLYFISIIPGGGI